MYEDFGVSVFTQDGERLTLIWQDENSATFAVKNSKISQLHVFIGSDGIDTRKEQDMQKMNQKAVLSAMVDLQ